MPLGLRHPPPSRGNATRPSDPRLTFGNSHLLITLPTPTNPDGTCLALLDRTTYKQLVCQTSYPCPVSRPRFPAHHIRSAGAAGIGLFAVRNLAAGELVLAERPLLVVPAAAPEEDWEACVARLPPAAHRSLMALSDVGPQNGGRPAARRVRTNSMRGVSLSGKEQDYLAVGALMGRVNHSCTPNAVVHFDSRALALELRALRNVGAGEELRISYCNAGAPLAIRRAGLELYRFVCNCHSCASGQAGDAVRARIRVPDLQFITSPAAKIERCLSQVMQLERAGLEVLAAYGTCVALLVGLYKRLGDFDKAAYYRARTDAWGLAMYGDANRRD